MTHTSHQSQGFCQRTAGAEFSPQSFWAPGCEWSKQWCDAVGSPSRGACPPERTSVNECTLLSLPVRDRKSRDSGKEINVLEICRDGCVYLEKEILKRSIYTRRYQKVMTDWVHVVVMYVTQTFLVVEITACVQSENTQLDNKWRHKSEAFWDLPLKQLKFKCICLWGNVH